MKKLRSILGNSGAVLTLALTLLTPFLLYGWFQAAIGAADLHIHPTYSGGEVSHVIALPGYRIVVNRPVQRSSPLQRIGPFVESPASAASLPARLSDEVGTWMATEPRTFAWPSTATTWWWT